MTLLKELIDIPELARCFDAALIYIRSAVQGCTSKATYLHGSFGSGKSHFMAVLHLILQGNAAARGIFVEETGRILGAVDIARPINDCQHFLRVRKADE